MHELYVILGKVGWTWLGVWLVLVAIGMFVQSRRRRRRNGMRGIEVTVSDEKQS